MNNNNTVKEKGVSSTSDLQKLYSSHVQERSVLNRHKSTLDIAKWKKLRELNNNEDLFLREHEQYISPKHRRNKRASMNAELVRVIGDELKTKERSSRIKRYASDTTIDRDAVCSECPYSLESWNQLVNSEHSIVDGYKQDILLSGHAEEPGTYEKKTDMLLGEPLKACTRLFKRRQTLASLIKTNDNSDSGVIDTVALNIQAKLKARGRRNTVSNCDIFGSHVSSLDSALKLPSIGKKPGSISSRKKSLTAYVSDQQPLSNSTYEHIDEHGLPFRGNNVINGRRVSLTDGIVNLEMQSPVSNIRINHAYSVCEGEKKDMCSEGSNNARPVANATIFVQGDLADIHKTESAYETDNYKKTSNTEQIPTPGSVMAAPPPGTTHHLVENNHVKDKTKHVTIGQVMSNNKADNKSMWADCIGRQIAQSRRRRVSRGTAGLKLLVDSHHGAAKLRYIVKLATEMEKEATGKKTAKTELELYKTELATECKSQVYSKHNAESESDRFKNLNECRYLRIAQKDDYIA